jgi:trehalose 6-phosphate phosphatase
MDPQDVAALLAPAEHAAIVLDVDGTLAPIVARPELAEVLPEARAELVRLVAAYGLVGVVSGRPTEEVADLVGVPGIRYEGLYGLQDSGTVPGEVIERAESAARSVEGAWVERKGVSLSVHLREAPDPEDATRMLAPVLAELARRSGLELVAGKRTLELAPPGPRKGGAVERLVEHADAGAVLYAGDDLPDLEAFEALDRLHVRGTSTVKVAISGTETPAELVAAADLVVEGPLGMVGLLRLL